MKLDDALDKTAMAARPEWKNKAVVVLGGMMLLMSFDKDVEPDWADASGKAITEAINATDYEPVTYSLDGYSRYRIVGQVFR